MVLIIKKKKKRPSEVELAVFGFRRSINSIFFFTVNVHGVSFERTSSRLSINYGNEKEKHFSIFIWVPTQIFLKTYNNHEHITWKKNLPIRRLKYQIWTFHLAYAIWKLWALLVEFLMNNQTKMDQTLQFEKLASIHDWNKMSRYPDYRIWFIMKIGTYS